MEFISGSIKRNNGKWSTSSESTNIAQRRVKRKRKIEENFTCASNDHNYLHVVIRLCQNRPIIAIKRKRRRVDHRPPDTKLGKKRLNLLENDGISICELGT